MKFFTLFIILVIFLTLSACSNSKTQETVVISKRALKSFPQKQEINDWKNALKNETHRQFELGQNQLDDIIKIVSEKTKKLEQPARIAYIERCIELSKFGHELALEASKELNDSEIAALIQSCENNIKKQLDETTKDNCRNSVEKDFSERRKSLIENYLSNIKETKTNNI